MHQVFNHHKKCKVVNINVFEFITYLNLSTPTAADNPRLHNSGRERGGGGGHVRDREKKYLHQFTPTADNQRLHNSGWGGGGDIIMPKHYPMSGIETKAHNPFVCIRNIFVGIVLKY